jgi:hypothetical protein
MLPPNANSGPLSDVFKAKVASLIKEQLKPIVTELAAQQQTLLTHIALLKHNHNVNDYQMTRLENIRDLEQSIKCAFHYPPPIALLTDPPYSFKVSGVLGFDPWQHPTTGTNLREPVPADPRLIPQFTPIDKATPAERAAVSVALVKEAGMSARQIGVPLTLQDFPDHPSISGVGKKEDPMHASNPLFGLNAPRWRAMQGLEDHRIPGTAAWDGVVARPTEKNAQQLYQRHAKQLKRPMWKLIAQGADPLGRGAASSSSSPGAGTRHSDVPDVPVGTSPFNATPVARPAASSSTSSTPPMRRALYRTYALTDIESTPNKASGTSSLRRTSTMTTIRSTISTTSEASSRSSLSKVSTTATIGSEPDPSSLLTTTTITTKSKAKAKKKAIGKQRDTRTKTAARPPPSPTSPSPPSTAPEQPKRGATLKRGRGAELDDTTDADGDINILQLSAEINQEKEEEGAEPARKRRKSSMRSNTSSTTTRPDGDGQEAGQGQQPRRSTRVTRASAAAAVPKPAARGRATKGKKANKRS